MEVHHHPRVEKKNFKEYFFEFIMIFLAVSMGFVAENIREDITRSEIEKSNIESFIRNLQHDSLSLLEVIQTNKGIVTLIDSLTTLPEPSLADTTFKKKFLSCASRLIYTDFFFPDESAYEQMKSSGTLRMKHANITDSILKYHAQNEWIRYQQDEVHALFIKSNDAVVHAFDFRPVLRGGEATFNNEQAIDDYVNYKFAESVSINIYLSKLYTQLSNVRSLIPFLKKEYNIR
ncbi:MAG TPA: hypothetical protein VHB70_12980 [Parafilimonas sp.]|nr:hypothetical protein [Parafilimonas sp.]